MKHISGTNKKQYSMLPPVLDDWISEGHPARVIDEFVESLEIEWTGTVDKRTGRPSYPPKVMLKILLYGYATGERSSRVLEKKTYDDIGFRWLSEDLHPDYRSIARFRQCNGSAMKNLLKETLSLYQEGGYEIKGVVFTDGTKIYANASDYKVASDKRIKQLEEEAKRILAEAEKADNEEDNDQGDNNNNFLTKESLEKIKAKIAEYKAKQKETGKKSASMTDGEANFMKHSSNKGIHLSYNAQITADSNGLILAADVTSKSVDGGDILEENLRQTEKNLEKRKIETIVADAGYYETESLRKLSNEGYKCLVPKRGKANNDSKFEYNSEKNTFKCEKGKILERETTKKSRKNRYDIYAAKLEDCLDCELCGKCYTGIGAGKYGRQLAVYEGHEFVEEHLKQLENNRELYDKRKIIVEPIIGILKDRHRFRGFLLRGLEKVKTEWNLVTTGFNLMKIWKLRLKNI
jgi:transposase